MRDNLGGMYCHSQRLLHYKYQKYQAVVLNAMLVSFLGTVLKILADAHVVDFVLAENCRPFS